MYDTTDHVSEQEPTAIVDRLTMRELDVILATVRGNSARQTARLLDISHRTVEAHLHAAYRKLGVHSALAAVPILVTANLLA